MTKDPHFHASLEIEAVRLLATVSRQFLTDRANRRDLAEAVATWQEAVSIADALPRARWRQAAGGGQANA
jgi:hypothetical protein